MKTKTPQQKNYKKNQEIENQRNQNPKKPKN